MEQLRHDREHAAEVPGSDLSFEHVGHGAGGYTGDRVRRVHRRPLRGEQAVHAPGVCQSPIAVQVAGVATEVLLGPELQRVDENAQHHAVGQLPGAVHEAQVPFMEEAHRGDEPDAAAARFLRAGPGAHGGQAGDFLHRYFWKECSASGYFPSRTSAANPCTACFTSSARCA